MSRNGVAGSRRGTSGTELSAGGRDDLGTVSLTFCLSSAPLPIRNSNSAHLVRLIIK